MATKGIELASAFISLSVSTDKVPNQVRDALRGIKDTHIDVDVDAETSGATANMARWRTTQERNPLKVKVDVDTKRAARDIDVLSSNLFKLGRSDIFKIGVGTAGIAALPSLAAGLAEVAAAMQKVAQAGLAVPGGIAGAVASVGTLAFGLSGISDAYDAVTKAADEAATSSGDQAAQTRAAASASNSLRNAVVDEAEARKDVARATRDARRELADLNLEMRGGQISQERAVLEAQKARERLATGDFTDIRDALLDIKEADQSVLETMSRNTRTAEDLADAQVKGIANSDQVVGANERLIRSQQNVAEAQASVAAAAPQATAAQEAAALAMGKLHPNAQALVETMRELVSGPLMDLRNLAQGNILEGISGQLSGFVTKAFPTFEKGIDGISKAWNKNFTEMFEVLGTDKNLSLLDRIFGNTAEAQTRLSDAFDPIVEAVATLAAAGSDSLPRLADAITGVSERFAEFITRADQDGRLQKWIDEGITSMGNLGEIALNVGKMFTAITNVSGQGTPLLQTIENLTTKWQTFLNSAEGQQTLQDLFAEGKQTLDEWWPVIQSIPGVLRGIYDGASTFASTMSEIFGPIATFLKEHPDLVKAAVEAYLLFKGAQILGAINTFKNSLFGISDALGTPGTGKDGRGGKGILGKLSLLTGITVGLSAFGGNEIANAIEGEDRSLTWAIEQGVGAPRRIWEMLTGQRDPNTGQPTYSGSGGNFDDTNAGYSGGGGAFDRPGGGQNSGSIFGRAASGAVTPYGLPKGSDSGGFGGGGVKFPQWVYDLGNAFGVKPSTYAGHQEGTGLNKGIDWVGPVENMQRFAEYLASVGGLEQVIWNNPSTGQKIGIANGQRVGPGTNQPGYYANDWGGHADHVHTRQSFSIPLPPWAMTADTGAVLPPGVTMVNNATGKPELILNPEQIQQLQSYGIDPNMVLQNKQQNPFGTDLTRTEGYIPAGAGNTAPVSGGGVFGGFINMGAEAINTLIDQAASAAAAGASMGANAFAPGSGAAAAQAIQMGAQVGKRLVKYGAEMANIGIGAASEIFFPFGAPRWLSDVNPMSFMPQQGILPAALTSQEKLMAQSLPGSQVDPATTQHGTAAAAPPGPVMPPMAPGQAPPLPGSGTGQPPGPMPSPTTDPMQWLKTLMPFDTGGVLQPRSAAVNLSSRPEYVFTQSQFKTMEGVAAMGSLPGGHRGNAPLIGELYAQDMDEAVREFQKVQNRSTRQYRGRSR